MQLVDEADWQECDEKVLEGANGEGGYNDGAVVDAVEAVGQAPAGRVLHPESAKGGAADEVCDGKGDDKGQDEDGGGIDGSDEDGRVGAADEAPVEGEDGELCKGGGEDVEPLQGDGKLLGAEEGAEG